MLPTYPEMPHGWLQKCEINIGIQALQDSVTNATHSFEDIGFWHYSDPAISATSNSTLLEWWKAKFSVGDSTPPEELGKTLGTLPPDFEFSFDASEALQRFVEAMFDGTFHAFILLSSWTTGSPNPEYAPIDALQSIFYGDFSGCGPDDDYLMCAVNNAAKAMTKTFRDSAYIAYGLAGANATLGETLATVSYVRIDWQWASLPFCVWIMAAALWCGTALKTRRANVPVWANNVLPLLFLHGKDNADESEIKHGTLNSDYLRRTEKINAQLQVADGKAVLNFD